MPTAQQGAAEGVVVSLVGMEFGGALPPPTAGAHDGHDGIDGGLQHAAVVDVGGGEPYGERDAVPVDHNMALAARFAAIRRVRPGLLAPLVAGMLAESREARLQSMRFAAPKRSSRV